jgi:hypothetical protein
MREDKLKTELEDTMKKDALESVTVNISMPRVQYLVALEAIRDEGFTSVSDFIQDCIREYRRQRNHGAAAHRLEESRGVRKTK